MNRYVFTIGVLICGAIFLLNVYVQHLIPGIIESGKAISGPMAFAIGVSGFWMRFWWMIILVVFGGLFTIQLMLAERKG